MPTFDSIRYTLNKPQYSLSVIAIAFTLISGLLLWSYSTAIVREIDTNLNAVEETIERTR
ncbi:MAG TPA: hypothetical protein PKL83_02610 [bacterium]|nr:hypothetical protein [bacterium]